MRQWWCCFVVAKTFIITGTAATSATTKAAVQISLIELWVYASSVAMVLELDGVEGGREVLQTHS